MFNPTVPCAITVASGKTNVYAEPAGTTTVAERCSIVKIRLVSKPTPISGESSASKSASREQEADVILLLSPVTKASINDIVRVTGLTLRVMLKSPVYDLNGRLDHHHVELAIWSGA
jgi:hypothetical protein